MNGALAALAILVSCLAMPSDVGQATGQPATTEAPAPIETAPSGVAGLTIGQLKDDAWAAWELVPTDAPSPSDQYTMIPERVASYVGQPVAKYPANCLTLDSAGHPGIHHVFCLVAAQRA